MIIYISSVQLLTSNSVYHAPFFTKKKGQYTEKQREEAIQSVINFVTNNINYFPGNTTVSMLIADLYTLENIENVNLTM
jgi:hypothetical protein